MIAKPLITLLFVFGFLFLGGQNYQLPVEVEEKRNGILVTERIAFYEFPFLSEKIDLRSLKLRYPSLSAPDYLDIVKPDVPPQNLTVFLALLNNDNPTSNSVIVWLAINYTSAKPIFLVDSHFSRDFTSETIEIIPVKHNGSDKSVVIYPPSKDDLPQSLKLKLPIKKKSKKKVSIVNQFGLEVFAGVGLNKLDFEYDNTALGFPTWYSVNATDKNIGLSLSYNLWNFRVSVTGFYQNKFYYTSYFNKQFDEQEIRIEPHTGRRILIENVEIGRNKDTHTTHHFQFLTHLAYRLHISPFFEVQPVIGAGRIAYMPREYEGFNGEDTQTYSLSSNSIYEAGLRFQFVTGKHKSIFVESLFSKSDWRPEGFFEKLPVENLNINHRTLKISIGYLMGL